MQFTDVLCYIFLTITVTASWVGAEEPVQEIEESKTERTLHKREATVILDNFPTDNYMDRIFQKPKVIYRRISKQRYGPPKPKYGPPKPKYRPSKVTRKPSKTRKGVRKPRPDGWKYGPPTPSKKHSPKSKTRRGPPKIRPGFGHVVKMPHYSFFVPDESGFGEPPQQYANDYQPPKQSYGEPPVDSYGAPLKSSIKDVYSTAASSLESTSHLGNQDFNRQELQPWHQKQNQNPDANFAYSKKHPTFSVPHSLPHPIFVTPEPKDYKEESFNSDVPDKQIMQDNKYFFTKKRPQYHSDNSKVLNRPWRPNKEQDHDEEIVVGGQYAEPPARYVSKLQPNVPIYDDDDAFSPSLHGYIDSAVVSSATNSPYSNYKHSNMAFSPQNLNDAFSIVDK